MNVKMTFALLSALTLSSLSWGCATSQPAQAAPAASAASVMASIGSASAGGGGAAASTSASDDRLDRLRSRAACAAMDMATALGERTSKADKRACEAQRAAAKASPPAKPKPVEPTAAQAAVLAAPPTTKHSSPPDWIERPPVKSGMIYGVGEGPDAARAFAKAIDMCAGQVKASIHSELEEESSQHVASSGGKDRVTGSESVSSTSKMIVRGVLEDVRIVDQYVDTKAGRTYVLASFDMAALQAKKQAIIEGVLESIAMATARLSRAMGSGRLDQADISNVIAVLVDITAIGRTRMGRELKSSWLKPYRSLKNAVSLLVECVEVSTPTGGKLPEPMRPGKLNLQVTCRGIPITNSSMAVNVSGGLASAPNTVATDGKGLLQMRVSQTYGKGEVNLSLRHDLSAIRNSEVLGKISESPRARWAMTTQGPATISMKVTGTKGENAEAISEGVAAWLSQKFGAELVKRGAQLKAQVRMNIEKSIAVGGKYTLPLRWQITVQGKGGTVFDRKGKTGVLADSPDQAINDAIISMFQRINRW